MGSVRYTNSFYSNNGTLYRIDLWDADHASTSTTFDTEAPGFTLNYPGEGGERFAPVFGSECVIYALNNSIGFDTLISDILGANEKRFAILIYKDGSLFWAGWVLTDLVEETDEPKPRSFKITASDFAILKYIDYDNAGTIYTDSISIVTHLLRIIGKTGLQDFWGATDDFLYTSVDWWDVAHPTRAEDKDPLLYTKFNTNVFNIKDTSQNTTIAMNCYDCLVEICKCFGMRLIQTNGKFCAIQVNNYADNNAYTRVYDKSGTQQDTDTDDFRVTIDQETNAILTTIQNRYYPPLQKVILKYNLAPYTNILPPQTNYEDEISLGIMLEDDRIKFTGVIKTIFTPDVGSLDNLFKCIFHLKIKLVGDSGTNYYLKGDNLQQTPAEWTTNASDRFIIRTLNTGGLFYSVTGMRDFKYTQIVIDANRFPERGTLYFELDLVSYIDMYNAAYTPNGTITYTCDNFKMVYVNADDSINSRKNIEAINQDAGGNNLNSYIYDHGELMLGDGKLTNEGALEASDDLLAWELTTSWTHATDASTLSISELLASEILSGQRVARAVMQGSITGEFTALNSLVYDSKKWVFNGGEFSAYIDEFNGEWFEIAENRTYIFSETEDDNIESDISDSLGTTVDFLNLLLKNLNIDENGNIIINVPSSESGLPTGALYNDSGTIKIKLP